MPDFAVINEGCLFICSDMSSLDESNAVHNNQMAFDILEKELGIPPVMSAKDLANNSQIDNLAMVFYLTQIQKAFSLPTKAKASGMSCFLIHILSVCMNWSFFICIRLIFTSKTSFLH